MTPLTKCDGDHALSTPCLDPRCYHGVENPFYEPTDLNEMKTIHEYLSGTSTTRRTDEADLGATGTERKGSGMTARKSDVKSTPSAMSKNQQLDMKDTTELDRQIAVMQAFRDGKAIEESLSGAIWTRKTDAAFDWKRCQYRIADLNPEDFPPGLPKLPEPPEGHKWVYRGKGWKAGYATFAAYASVEDLPECWVTGDAYTKSHDPNYHYAEAVPIEPVRVPLTADDIPAVCWVRQFGTTLPIFSVGRVYQNEIYFDGGGATYEGLMNCGYEYSSDRKNWKPCYKEQ